MPTKKQEKTTEKPRKHSKGNLDCQSWRKQVLQLLDLQSEDDLPEALHELAKNKKKSEDTWVPQRAIDDQASAPASAAESTPSPSSQCR